MRLYKHINENFEMESDLAGAVEVIKRDCKPFLKEFNNSLPVFRGMSRDLSRYDLVEIQTRMDRKPKDTPEHLHKLIDQMFQQKFGWKVRSQGVFTSQSKAVVRSYGMEAYFFPIGKYSYVWSKKVKDLYQTIKSDIINKVLDDNMLLTRDIEPEHITPEFKDMLEDIISTYTDKRYPSKMKRTHECIFRTKSYYVIYLDNPLQEGLFLNELGLQQ